MLSYVLAEYRCLGVAVVFFLSAQETVFAATQFILDLDKALETKSNMSYVYEVMHELNSRLDPLFTGADAWVTNSSAMPVDTSEAVVVLAHQIE